MPAVNKGNAGSSTTRQRKARRQHCVPQFLIKEFEDNGDLYFFDKTKKNRGVEKRNPKSVFVDRDFYNIVQPDGTKDSEFDELNDRLESDAAPVIKRIICRVRMNKPPRLSVNEKRALIQFYLLQRKRTPIFIKTLVNDYNSFEHQKEIIRDFEETDGPLTEEKKNIIRSARYQNEAARRGVLGPEPELITAEFQTKGLLFAYIPEAGRRFIIGDFSIAHLGQDSDQPAISNHGNEYWLPLAYDIAMTVSPIELGREQIRKVNQQEVRRINEKLFDKSERVASGSRRLLCSLKNRK